MNKYFLAPQCWAARIVWCALCSFLSVTHALAAGYHECVGRYELTLPGQVDVATIAPQVLSGKEVDHPVQFPDGQPVLYGSAYLSLEFDGEFKIFQGVSDKLARDFINKNRDFIRANGKEIKGKSNEPMAFYEIQTGQPDSFAMSGYHYSEFDIYRNGQLTTFNAGASQKNPEIARNHMLDTLANLHVRNLYEIPRGMGVCLPGIFVADKNTKNLVGIGVTFRLKEHPDVTILFLDGSAGDLSEMTSRKRNEFEWNSNVEMGKIVHLQGTPGYRSTIMAGRLGTASFGAITRYDDTTDYAYLVTVQGDPKASVDTPDLELLVERTAKNAKGVPPVSAD